MRYHLLRTGTLGILLAGLVGCAGTGTSSERGTSMKYQVHRLNGDLTLDARWDNPAWQNVPTIELTHYMGERPSHMPKTQARLLYDDKALYVLFRVEDQHVRAVAQKHQDPVCQDSCVEFFFTPSSKNDGRYFNIEMNCGGIMLFHFQDAPRKRASCDLEAADLERVEIAHSLPKNVEPEITAPTLWTVEYRVPFEILTRCYPDLVKPSPGAQWRANLYKCADSTSQPHWLSWAKVNKPKPDFHVPADFGILEFK